MGFFFGNTMNCAAKKVIRSMVTLNRREISTDAIRTIDSDPRTDPRVVTALNKFKMPKAPRIPLWTPRFLLHAAFKYGEAGKEKVADAWLEGLPKIKGVTNTTKTIKGVDGNDIQLFISTPTSLSQPAPCVVHFHGGGMVIFSPEMGCYVRWREELALRGLICVSVKFRNASGNHNTPAPFPAGLNDGVSAIKWVVDNKEALKVSKVLSHGESGGGNLCIASAMKAAAAGIRVDGVYACCPYLSNCWDTSPEHGQKFPSLVEFDGYLLDVAGFHISSRLYTETNTSGWRDGLAWPYHASDKQLNGLPKTVISVNELDPLRDEGLSFSDRLRKLGVEGYSRIVKGTPHGVDVGLPADIPDITSATLDDVALFAKSM